MLPSVQMDTELSGYSQEAAFLLSSTEDFLKADAETTKITSPEAARPTSSELGEGITVPVLLCWAGAGLGLWISQHLLGDTDAAALGATLGGARPSSGCFAHRFPHRPSPRVSPPRDTVSIPGISPAVNDSCVASVSPFLGKPNRVCTLESPTIAYSCPSSRCTIEGETKASVSHSVVSDSLQPHELQPASLLSTGLSRQEYWGGCRSLLQGSLPDTGSELGSTALQAESLSSEPRGHGRHRPKDAINK